MDAIYNAREEREEESGVVGRLGWEKSIPAVKHAYKETPQMESTLNM